MTVSALGAAPRNLARTKADILEVATEHFAHNGYFGARADEITAKTSTVHVAVTALANFRITHEATGSHPSLSFSLIRDRSAGFVIGCHARICRLAV
jgi:hypothetical protein